MSSKCTRIFAGVACLSGISVSSPFLVLWGVASTGWRARRLCTLSRSACTIPAIRPILGPTPWFSLVRRTLFLQRELVDVDVADPECISASGQIVHVAVVNLFGLDLDGFALVRLQRLGPAVKGPGVVRLQRLPAGQREARL